MDLDTGEIHTMTPEEAQEYADDHNATLIALNEEEYRELVRMSPGKRKHYFKHRSCPCGSGRKFMKCCMRHREITEKE